MFRIGHSRDIHKLVKGRDLVLGGLSIDYELGLLGHSDADVLTHTIIESIIGAMGKGDIGTLFPDNDNTYKDISSLELLKEVLELMDKEGYSINNIDSTVYLELPKLNPLIHDIKESLNHVLKIDIDLINIKATTREELDSVGQGKAIEAETIILLSK
ncbi:MAG: 2-C-methyl-D-erythritol 2,4-cyclodiphosphate synthase [Mycoplasmatales bacterium]